LVAGGRWTSGFWHLAIAVATKQHVIN
jgi:hypothetical protein